MPKKYRMPALALGLLALAAAAYFLWPRPAPEDVTIVDQGPAGSAQASFLQLVAELGPIAFDTSVLSDPEFLSLQDIRTAIVPEEAGRADPFGPLR